MASIHDTGGPDRKADNTTSLLLWSSAALIALMVAGYYFVF